MNIDIDELDFSEKSINILDESLVMNYRSPFELVSTLSAYVELTLTRNQKEIKWDIEGYRIGFKSDKGELYDLIDT